MKEYCRNTDTCRRELLLKTLILQQVIVPVPSVCVVLFVKQNVLVPMYLVPLRTGTCYIRDIFVLFLQDYCALQELLMKMNFTIAVAPPFVHPMTSLPAMPTHSVQKYGFFSEPARRRQLAKYGNLKHHESLIFW